MHFAAIIHSAIRNIIMIAKKYFPPVPQTSVFPFAPAVKHKSRFANETAFMFY